MSPARTISVILLGSGLILIGNGLLQTMLPMRADLLGFTTSEIGYLGAAYFVGIILGCHLGPGLIRAVGHVRAHAGTVALLTALVVLFPIWSDPVTWIGLRLLTGVCLAIVFMTLESWLNDQASNENRGRVLSLYIIVTNLGWILGQVGINAADLLETLLFLIAAVAICLSAAIVALTPTSEPSDVPEARLDLRSLLILSPVGTVGCFLVGTAEGAFWSLGPIFGQQSGMSVFEVTMLMGAFVLGGTISQWPIGWLSDNHDRRLVILPITLATVVTGLGLVFVADFGFVPTLIVAMAHGALMIPIYSLCIAHVNDATPSEKFVQASGGLLLIYSAGAALGPLIAAPLMERTGTGALFVVISALLGSLALFILYRLVAFRRVARAHPGRFSPASRTTQAAYELETD